MGASASQVLTQWIAASRAHVIAHGVRPIPHHIRESLRGFIPDDVLASIQYRAGWGNEIQLPPIAFRFGDATAVTLGEIILFRSEQDAHSNTVLWVHEIAHVLQQRALGGLEFARRYVRDFQSLEREADDASGRYTVWYNQQINKGNNPMRYWPQQAQSMPQQSNLCRTPAGACFLSDYTPVGTHCFCTTVSGPVYGAAAP